MCVTFWGFLTVGLLIFVQLLVHLGLTTTFKRDFYSFVNHIGSPISGEIWMTLLALNSRLRHKMRQNMDSLSWIAGLPVSPF